MNTARRSVLLVALALALLARLPGAGPAPARAASFVVNASSDDANAHDTNPGDGSCSDALGRCTLRAAIEEANALVGVDTITFASQMTIYLSAAEGQLPALTSTITIDASSVWDTLTNAPGVALNGGGANADGLAIYGSYCAVYGLHITNFGQNGIRIESFDTTIGSPDAGKRNVLSGNGAGLRISGSIAHGNVVQGNYIGLSASGTSKEPNANYGIIIDNEASANTIGGDEAGEGNYISGNGTQPGAGDGVFIATLNTFQNKLGGNYIGVAADNLTPLGNAANGVHVTLAATDTQIGGPGLLSNAIVHNAGSGVFIENGSSTDVQSNLIWANGAHGVRILDSSSSEIYFNTITGNTEHGVLVENATSLYNQIVANSIYDNGGLGIDLANGGNQDQAAPTITTASVIGASGTAVAGSRIVYVYSDPANEGGAYHGMCIVNTVTGEWTYTGTLYGPNVTAIAADVDGNTSEFSAPFYIGPGGQFKTFLPSVMRNH